jgi:alpha-galactosidase
MLLDEIRFLHPDVEIESCASGGGRIDHEILRRTDRVWTSDTNDPLLRQTIQHHTSLLVPPEMMGCHIGAPTAHTTNKTSSLTFRAITAMFGHLGIEWNLLQATPTEREELRAVVALHKELRPVLHTGHVIFSTMLSDSDGEYLAHGVVSPDLGRAVVAVSRLLDQSVGAPPKLHIAGLDHRRLYTVSCVLGQPHGGDYVISHHSGYDLEHNGLEILPMHPESAVLLTLESS